MPELDAKNAEKAKNRASGHSFSNYCDQLIGSSPTHEMREIIRLHRLVRFFRLYSAAADQVSEIFRGVVYIGPARSRSERYYRYQELSVSEIDPDGTNFPMFLNSLLPSQIERFSGWVKNLFGFGVNVSRKEGHLSINVEYAKKSMNIVDTGYGVSQILPVLGQIWWTVFGAVRHPVERNAILAIEQPELHLHPAHQSLLADAITSVLGDEQKRKVSFIVETHSESLINRLGNMVYEKKLDASAVSLLIFEESTESANGTTTREAHFEGGGVLVNWPYGFFNVETP
jgi:predicted ATPase